MDSVGLVAPDGAIAWKMGRYWSILPPNEDGSYSEANLKCTLDTPVGVVDVSPGKGSLRRSLQIVGSPRKDTSLTVRMGSFDLLLRVENGKPTITLTGGREAANKRWSAERLARTQTPPQPPHHQPITPPSEHQSVRLFTEAAQAQRVLDQAQWEWLRSAIYLRDKGICWVCHEFVLLRDYDLGHIVDRTKGGADSLENCAVMHKHCNIGKPRHETIAEASAWKSRNGDLSGMAMRMWSDALS